MVVEKNSHSDPPHDTCAAATGVGEATGPSVSELLCGDNCPAELDRDALNCFSSGNGIVCVGDTGDLHDMTDCLVLRRDEYVGVRREGQLSSFSPARKDALWPSLAVLSELLVIALSGVFLSSLSLSLLEVRRGWLSASLLLGLPLAGSALQADPISISSPLSFNAYKEEVLSLYTSSPLRWKKDIESK